MSATTHLLDQARALRESARPGEAIALLRKGLQSSPDNGDLLHELGNALRSQGQHGEALPLLEAAARLLPANAICWLNLGVTLYELGRNAEASEPFRRAVSLAPWMPEAHNILGCTLLALGRSEEAGACFTEALRLRPAYPAALDNLGRCLRAQGLMAEALARFEEALRLKSSPTTHSNALMALNYLPGIPVSALVERHRDWGRRHAAKWLAPASTLTGLHSARAARLRLGYVSGDLCNHSVSYFLAPVLAHHDKSRFEVTCYKAGHQKDATTERLRGLCERWRDIAALDDDAAARLIREDGIDILVDLSGHTANNRLLVFARRPAPLQLTWLGYPSTTGLPNMDWRISDGRCLPAGEDAEHGTEKILRLPGPFCCYEPPPAAPPVSALPELSHRHPPLFCSFNNLAKLSGPCLLLWGRLLRSLPGSGLLLKSPGADSPAARRRVRELLAAEGVTENRIHFHGRPLPMEAHLSLYQDCHIALDPFPYNGTTTTCEALLMGIPVVTLAGETHVSRVGASLLHWVGLDSLVAQDSHDYLDIASSLAGDLPRLASLRATLRDRLLASPLCNARLFTHQFESTLLRLALQSG